MESMLFCRPHLIDWLHLERVDDVVLFVGYAMLKWGVLNDVIAEVIEVCYWARDGSSVSQPIPIIWRTGSR